MQPLEKGVIPRLSMLFFVFLMALTILAPSHALAQAAEAIGSVLKVKGTVDAIRDGKGQILKKADPVFKGDVIQTSLVGSIVLKLVDDSLVFLDAESQIVLDEMVYDPQTGSGQIAMNAVQGIFSFVSGKVSANTSSGMNVRSPSMTIGIRGTVDLLEAKPAGLTSTIITKEGRSTARNNTGSVNLVAGDKAQAKGPDEPISKSKSTPEDEQKFETVQEEVSATEADDEAEANDDRPVSALSGRKTDGIDTSSDTSAEKNQPEASTAQAINKTPYRPVGKATGQVTYARTTSGSTMVSSTSSVTEAGSTSSSGGSYPSSIVCNYWDGSYYVYYFKISSGPTLTAGSHADHDMKFSCNGSSSYAYGPDANPQSGNDDTDVTFSINGVTFTINFSVSGNNVTINKFE